MTQYNYTASDNALRAGVRIDSEDGSVVIPPGIRCSVEGNHIALVGGGDVTRIAADD